MKNSPARTYFKPMSIDLDGGGWLSAMFMTSASGKTVMVFENIRKGGIRLESHSLIDLPAVAAVAEILGEKYPEVPWEELDRMVDRSRILFAAEDALAFRSRITTNSHCSSCSILERDEVLLEIFPPMPGTPLDQGSTSILWPRFCKDGRTENVEVCGTFTETADAAVEVLTAMMALARPETQPQLRAALALLSRN